MNSHSSIIFKVMGILMMGFSFTFLPPIVISFIYSDHQYHNFLYAFAIIFFLGLLLWIPFRKSNGDLKTRKGFIIVALFWIVFSFICALPFYFSEEVTVSFAEALFEATSGFTTTGATVLSGLDNMPKSILWYRAQLQFLGGMGIIILAVAIMPLLGMGGMALFKAEIPGPMKEEKLTPRIAQTARNLWNVYLILLTTCALAYYIAGMDAFDAITHSFTTVATAGFSNYDNSLGHFESSAINWIAITFMFVSAMSFTLHFLAFKEKKIVRYFKNFELKVFFYICFISAMLVAVTLYFNNAVPSFYSGIENGFFMVISMITTTGYTISSFSEWPVFLPLFIVFLAFIGGCSGSTSGGIKVIRIILQFKQIAREIKYLIHPRAELSIRMDGKIIQDSILGAVWAFLGLYICSTVVLTLVMIALGLPALDAFSVVAACLNIAGPALGSVSQNYSSINDAGLVVLTFTMLLGRLEIFTLFVLLMPSFWRS